MLSRAAVTLLSFAVIASAAVTGCLSTPGAPGADDAGAAIESLSVGGNSWTWSGSAGGLSTLALAADGASTPIGFGEGVLVLTEDGRLAPATKTVPVAAGESVTFLPPPGAGSVVVDFGGESVTLATPDTGEQFLSGEHAIRLLEIQRDNFPHRTPGHENYAKSQQYFAEYFESFGYEVEVDPFGTMALDGVKGPAGPQPGPSSVANVVAFKQGTLERPRYIVFGGHYDVVEATTEGAFDNTAGTVAVMELARAFANVTTAHTLVFALWGGEEDGILGSRFWVQTNPDKVPAITTYYNLDVTGMAWPGPAPQPDPILVIGAPDGEDSERLLDAAAMVNEKYTRFPEQGAEFRYEPWVVGGQVGGTGINAQSDHTSFASVGVPAMMFSSGNLDTIFAVIHSEADTLANMTAYMATGKAPFEEGLTDEERVLGRDLLARSIESQIWLPFYLAVLDDAGLAMMPR